MDPTLKTRTISELKKRTFDLSPRLQRAAKYILDNEADFGLDSIRETARKSGVSSYTLVRLSREMGFDGFEDLRKPFRHALVSLNGPATEESWLEKWQGSNAGAVTAAASNAMAIVSRSLERQSPERIREVAELMVSAHDVYVTGMRASYGLAYYFQYVGRMALKSLQIVPRQMSSAIDELTDAGPDDVLIAITFTPYSHETIEAMAYAKSRGMRLVVVSDSEIVAPGLTADHTLLVSTNSTHHFGCSAGAMAVLEMLLAMLVEIGGSDAARRIETYERLRNNYRAYWSAKKNKSF